MKLTQMCSGFKKQLKLQNKLFLNKIKFSGLVSSPGGIPSEVVRVYPERDLYVMNNTG